MLMCTSWGKISIRRTNLAKKSENTLSLSTVISTLPAGAGALQGRVEQEDVGSVQRSSEDTGSRIHRIPGVRQLGVVRHDGVQVTLGVSLDGEADLRIADGAEQVADRVGVRRDRVVHADVRCLQARNLSFNKRDSET